MKKVIVPVFYVFILMAGTAFLPAPTVEGNSTGAAPGEKAPNFALEDLHGNTIKLSDYRGKKVIVLFWTDWCPACMEELPAFNRFYAEAGDNIILLAVHIDPTNDLPSFVKKKKILFPVLADHKGKVSHIYRVNAWPTTYFIDEKGRITRKHVGVLSYENLQEYCKD